MSGRVPSAGSSVLTLASVTWTRLVRGRGLWIGVAIACLPIGFASLLSGHRGASDSTLFILTQLLLAVLPAMFVAASVGEEIEDRTATYLWSRPIPRWAVLGGKLAALVPLVVACVVLAWLGAAQVGLQHLPEGQTILALALGGVACSFTAAGIATIAPRHGMALAVLYMVFDLPVAAIPASIQELSLSHHVRVLAGQSSGSTWGAVLGLALIGGGWLAIAVRRMKRLET